MCCARCGLPKSSAYKRRPPPKDPSRRSDSAALAREDRMAKHIVELRQQLEKLGRTSGQQPAAPSAAPWTSGTRGEAASKRARIQKHSHIPGQLGPADTEEKA
eukprot:8899337-Pyramimonas_sp.AAC.1